MTSGHQIVLSTCPASSAEVIATLLVDERLAACVNIVPAVQSIYRWQGKIQNNEESLLIIKTRADLYPELASMLRSEHPYEIPEIIAFDIDNGATDYLEWLSGCLLTRQ